jgi:hypothetical protein
MCLDRPLAIGAGGGHGPIRYVVEACVPGRHVKFRFLGPRGFDGWHGFDVIAADVGETVLRHSLEMTTRGSAVVTWPLVFRPLHDASCEDGLARAAVALGMGPHGEALVGLGEAAAPRARRPAAQPTSSSPTARRRAGRRSPSTSSPSMMRP